MSHSNESDQSFISARSDMSDDGSTDADAAPPFERTSSATERSRVLTEAENQAINEKIDRLIAVIQAGRQLRFSPDPHTGNVDISVAHDKSDVDDGRSDVEADIAASPENFGNIIRTGDGRQRILSPNSILSDSTDISKIMRYHSSSEWEPALTLVHNRAAVKHVPEGQIPPPVLKRDPGEVRGAIRRDSKHFTYWGRNDVKVAPIASIPLDFNKPLPIATPSVHSAGSDLDCSSPLFEKSFQRLMRETSGDLPRSEDANQDSWSSGIGDRVSDWLERVPVSRENTDATRKRQSFKVFQDKVLNRGRKSLTASKALRDVSNLRRPGHLQHNSFAQTSQVAKTIGNPVRPGKSGTQIQPFGGAANAESRRSFIEAKWPVLVSSHNSGRKGRPTTMHQKLADLAQSIPHPRQRRRKNPSPPKSSLQHPNRTADFDLALARLEGHAPPRQYSPIQRYADDTGVYNPDVLVESRRLRPCQPVPMRVLPFGLSTVERLEQEVTEGAGDTTIQTEHCAEV
ncbi:hypothetical protein JMJ35_007333 [Cladonia borealis]|uniref:Uncharacterized protein n=1 Tax=Cladonia borealis TaxID=184061 RepID=A0AA39V3I5_9LECA|nr:hypothetical protein JMJ35_007333 [Cladonia borealis]